MICETIDIRVNIYGETMSLVQLRFFRVVNFCFQLCCLFKLAFPHASIVKLAAVTKFKKNIISLRTRTRTVQITITI